MPRMGRPAAARRRRASCQAEALHPVEVGEGGAAARQHDEVGTLQVGRARGREHVDAGFGGERVQVGGVGDPWEADGRDAQGAGAPGKAGPRGEGQRVLAVEPDLVEPGEHAEAPQAGPGSELVESGIEHALVAAELVDQVAGDQRPVCVVDDRPVPVDRGKDAATVDVADEQGRQPEPRGKAEVHVVAGAEVDLGRRTGTFGDDQVVGLLQLAERLEGRCRQSPASGGVLAGLERAARLAPQDDEGPAVGRRLEQDGVHHGGRLDARRERLQVLGAADLRAVGADHRVVAHVLRLEGCDLDPLSSPGATQPGRDE